MTVNGTSEDTQYGPVQVRITVRGKRLVKVTAVVYPSSGGRDQEISSFALPRLEQEAIAAQNARIDAVSGATFTSDGYRRSLQSALDAAHFRTAG
ncbi:MAG TPA: FMN-binding protein [Kribbella sp.]